MPTRKLVPWLLLSPVLVTLAIFVVAPVVIIFSFSFFEFLGSGADRPAFRFENWKTVFTDTFYLFGLYQTAKIALLAGCLRRAAIS